MKNRKNLLIVCQPSLSAEDSTKFYIFESSTDPEFDECTLIGDVGITAHIVGIENTFDKAELIYKQLVEQAEYRHNQK